MCYNTYETNKKGAFARFDQIKEGKNIMAKSAYEKVYESLKKAIQKTDTSAFKGFFAFQFTVTGDAAGTFYAKFAEGDDKITVENFDYKGATATFVADAATFTALVEGKLAPADAVKSGALVVEGNEAGCADIFGEIAPKKAAKKAAAPKAEKKAPAAKKAAAPKAEKKAPAAEKKAPAAEKKAPAAKKPAAPKAEKKAPAAKKPAAPKAEVKAEAPKTEAPKAEAKKPAAPKAKK